MNEWGVHLSMARGRPSIQSSERVQAVQILLLVELKPNGLCLKIVKYSI